MRKDGIGRGLVWPAQTQDKRHDAGEGSHRQRFAASDSPHSNLVVSLAPLSYWEIVCPSIPRGVLFESGLQQTGSQPHGSRLSCIGVIQVEQVKILIKPVFWLRLRPAWTRQFGVSIKYVDHAEKWDSVEIDGSLEGKDCVISYKQNGRRLAIATIGRDLENLRAEVEMEAGISKFIVR